MFEERDKEINQLAEQCATFKTPEWIDDGQRTHPAARILQLFPEYQKAVDGPLIAEAIGLDTIRKRCHHFNDWLTKLEALAAQQARA